ncbi:MAG: hypothetical protein IH614_13505, partial [Desulfuromonadales bacterium]|nr:hypothetical protein [Desulfuromonadales bacterium]
MLTRLPAFLLPLLLLLLGTGTAGADEVKETCRQIGHKLGSVSLQGCLDRHLQPSGHYSVEN